MTTRITNVDEALDAIGAAYARLVTSKRVLQIRDHGQFAANVSDAEMRRGIERSVMEGPHCRLGSSDRNMQRLLFETAWQHRPKVAIEFGTCFGVSAAALAFGMGGGRLVTIEADPTLASIAREQLNALGLGWVDVRQGTFGDVLSSLDLDEIELVFDDGDHTGYGERQRLEQLLPRCAERVRFIWDDIRWSAKMLDWWKEVSHRPEASDVQDKGRAGSLIWTQSCSTCGGAVDP
jgi:predicted O-methyltransferase YrrM